MWTISLRDDERENVTMSEILERQLPLARKKKRKKKKMKMKMRVNKHRRARYHANDKNANN